MRGSKNSFVPNFNILVCAEKKIGRDSELSYDQMKCKIESDSIVCPIVNTFSTTKNLRKISM